MKSRKHWALWSMTLVDETMGVESRIQSEWASTVPRFYATGTAGCMVSSGNSLESVIAKAERWLSSGPADGTKVTVWKRRTEIADLNYNPGYRKPKIGWVRGIGSMSGFDIDVVRQTVLNLFD